MREILIVEDDLELARELCCDLSERYIPAQIAETGARALEALRSGSFAFCLLDVGLPDCSGFDLCREIRKFYRGPILMLTAFDSEDDIVRGLQSGADDYVAKPFSLRVLHSRIDAQLRRSRWSAPPVPPMLESGDLLIDFTHRMIFSSGKEIPVSAMEFSLCEALLRNDRKILPRDMLLQRLWDDNDHFVENNTLSVHISRLRKKLGRCRGEDYIETVKGIGYRWNIEVRRAT